MTALAATMRALAPALVGLAVLRLERHRSRRRAAAVSAALHEVRRPLHSLALSPGAEDLSAHLELARLALADAEGALRGERPEHRAMLLDARDLVGAAVARTRPLVAAAGGRVALDWRGGPAPVLGDRRRLAQAVDNLVANAVEHGGGAVRIEGAMEAGWVRIAVRDAGRSRAAEPAGREQRTGRGHGLAIASAIASEHGGRAVLRRGARGALALLELPAAVR